MTAYETIQNGIKTYHRTKADAVMIAKMMCGNDIVYLRKYNAKYCFEYVHNGKLCKFELGQEPNIIN